MESQIIDRLYDTYKNCNFLNAESILKSAFLMPDASGGGEVLIEHVKNYINANIGNLPNYFSSKETLDNENDLVRNIIYSMKDIALVVDEYKSKRMMSELNAEEMFNDLETFEMEYQQLYGNLYINESESYGIYASDDNDFKYITYTSPQELFFMRRDVIQSAYDKYATQISGVTPENLEKLLNFFDYVKSNDLINKIYKNNDISQMSIENVIPTIVYADENIAKNIDLGPVEFTTRDVVGDYELFDYIQSIRNSCEDTKDIDFKQYRARLISLKKGINVDLDKLIFARNYLEFIRTGIIPNPNGMMYFDIDQFEKLNLIDDFNRLYRNGFDNKEFAEHQANFIFDIDNSVLRPDRCEKYKSVKNDKSLAIGLLLSSRIDESSEDAVAHYLVHINIDDVTNSKSNYELQLNILPQESIENRVQLVRFDNWSEEQTHRNIGNKLNTTTHIHLYNHFDLLRGKKNGAFDIAFNLAEKSTDFETALKVFLEFVVSDEKLRRELFKKVLKTKDLAVASFEGSGME